MLLLLLQVTLMTYNLRFDTVNDGENRWDLRKEHLAAVIRHEAPHFLGTQEGLHHQLEYLSMELDGYGYIGVGRDDGVKAGEFSAIFYDTRRVDYLEDSGKTIWLSETPEIPGKSWDAALPRVLTYGGFRIKSTSDTIYVFNTHFDHVGQLARENSSRLILDEIRRVAGNRPFVLMGDFNVTPQNPVYRILTYGDDGLNDAMMVTETAPVGPKFTFEGFAVRNSAEAVRIDYIFVPKGMRVRGYAVISSFRNGNYPSDHLPVVARVEF